MLLFNIFIVLKVKFSVSYDVKFTVNITCSEMTKLWLTQNCVISSKMRKPYLHYCALASLTFVLAAMGKPQLVLRYKHFTTEQVPVDEDCNVDSVYRKLLILDQICCSYLNM